MVTTRDLRLSEERDQVFRFDSAFIVFEFIDAERFAVRGAENPGSPVDHLLPALAGLFHVGHKDGEVLRAGPQQIAPSHGTRKTRDMLKGMVMRFMMISPNR